MKARSKDLSESLAAIRRAIPANSPAEAMNLVSVHLGLRDDEGCGTHATLSARNSHLNALAECPCEGGDEAFNLPKDAIEAIHSIARRFPDTVVSIQATQRKHIRMVNLPDVPRREVAYDEVIISAQGSRFCFEVFHAPPNISAPPNMSASLSFEADPLRDVLALLRDVHDERHALNLTGIHLSGPHNGYVTASATDGRRIVRVRVPAMGSLPDGVGTVIPYRLATAVLPLLADHDGPVHVAFTDNLCGIRIGSVIYYGTTDTRPFPNLDRNIDRMAKVGKPVGSVNRTTLKQSLELARVCTNPALDVVGVMVESTPDGGLRFSSVSPDRGQAVVTPPIGVTGQVQITVDPSYITPMLSRVCDENVELTVDGANAIQFTTSHMTYLLMGIDR